MAGPDIDDPASGLRAVVLGGAGKVFCAGADLSWMSKMIAYTEEENLRDAVATASSIALMTTSGSIPFSLASASIVCSSGLLVLVAINLELNFEACA